ncbi:MAG: tetratricopeptide repeat protein, partial [Deltaproteobacteria bacterium]|nr:tetratricopeptide repeat protein [Deltaproteobacteria bacterium]
AGVGGEFALDTGGEPVALAPSLLRGAGELAEEDKEEEDRTKLIRRRKRRILVAFVSAPVLIFAMAFIPLVLGGGPFGWHWITDTLNRSRYESELDAFRTSAQAGLGTDTRAAAERAFEGAKALQIDMPRFAPMAAYTALVGYMMSLRFGPDSAREAFAKDVLESLGAREPSELCTLATAAQAAVEGKLARARQAAAALSRRLPKDVDAAVLSAEVALGAKETAPALELWRAAVKLDGSARSLYGLARAELAAGNPDQAIKTARRALEKSKLHAGARTLIAAVLWEKRADEEAAIKLLKEVTAKGAVREAASKSELVAAHSQLGEILLSFSRYSDAEEAFKEAMKLDPQAERALCGNGELYYQQGRFAEALGRFDAAVRANPDSIDARVGIAKTYLSTERAKDARNLMQKTEAAAAKAKDPLVGYWQGRAEETLGNKKEAEAAYRRAIEVGGTDVRTVQAYVALANLLAGLGRAEEAARVLADATEKLPKSAALHNARGDIALRAGQFDEARKQFEQALALDPKNLASRFKLAVTLRRLQEYEQAQQMLEDLSKRDPSYPGLAIELGSLYADTGQTERAMAMINEALVRAPDDPDAKLRLAQLLVQQNNAGLAKRAETLLREVQKVRPQSAEVAHFLGRALLLQRTNLADALGLLEFATGRDENRAEYWLYYGWAAIDANQYDVAAKALDRALRLDRNLGDAFWLRGKLRHLLGASVDALRDLETALEKNPSRYEAYATMAFCYTAEIDHPKAQAAWRKAIEGNDQVAEWHYRLGKSLWQQGNRAAATPELVRAVELTDQAQAAGESIELARNWLFDANYLLYDAYKSADKVKAVQHARRYLSLAPRDHAYLQEVDRFLKDNDEIQ